MKGGGGKGAGGVGIALEGFGTLERASLKEASHWGQALRYYRVALILVHPLLPDRLCSMTSYIIFLLCHYRLNLIQLEAQISLPSISCFLLISCHNKDCK